MLRINNSKVMSQNLTLLSKDDLREVIFEMLQQFGQPRQTEPSEGNDSPLLTREEAAKILDISLVTLHQWVKDGRIPTPKKIGKRVYFLKQGFTDFLRSQDFTINRSKSTKKG